MVKIDKRIMTTSRKFAGTNKKTNITVHQTGNSSKGANAEMHHRFLINGGGGASWHITVDDKIAIQHYSFNDRLFHAGDGRRNGNMNSIGIEVCINSDGNYNKTIENLIDVLKWLKQLYPNIGIVQHNHWSGKNCPMQIRQGKNGWTWNKILKAVSDGKPASGGKAKKLKNENALFTATEDIKTRTTPTVYTDWYGMLKKGQTVEYHEVYSNDGYRWLMYYLSDGKTKRYVPYRSEAKPKEVWGKFSEKKKDPAKKKKDSLYKVQTGAYSKKENASKKADDLKKDGHDTYITKD